MIAQLNFDYQFLCYIKWKKAKRKLALGAAETLKVTETGKILAIRLLKLVRKAFGSSVKYSKRNVHARDSYTCQYCGSKGTTIDHVIPKSRGGRSDCFENTVSCCKPCNAKKGDKLPSEVGMYLRKKPVKPTIAEFFLHCGRNFNFEF